MLQRSQEHQGTLKNIHFLIDLMAYKHSAGRVSSWNCRTWMSKLEWRRFLGICSSVCVVCVCVYTAEVPVPHGWRESCSFKQWTTGNRQCCCWRQRGMNFVLLSSLVGGSRFMSRFPRLISGVLLMENLLHASQTRSLQQLNWEDPVFAGSAGTSGGWGLSC